MQSKKYREELENYAKNATNFDVSETLQAKEHMLIVENGSSKELKQIYKSLNDLADIDLIDFFEMERRNGGEF